jgi:hypothetical protein
VLDVDELGYLDELSYLIERSKYALKELCIGISEKATGSDFAATRNGPEYRRFELDAQRPDEGSSGGRRLGRLTRSLPWQVARTFTEVPTEGQRHQGDNLMVD